MLADRLDAEPLPFINMTPMVDVILCLLIFFMAATRLYEWDEEEFRVNVPEVGQAAPLTAAPQDLNLNILEPGRIQVDDQSYDLAALLQMLQAAKMRYAKQGVVVRGDAQLAYQDLADVLSCCESAGIQSVRLIVRPKESSPAGGLASP
jgi:biopolymer transport protein ExbD